MTSATRIAAPTEADWSAALTTLTRPGPLVLACHVHPDGDALGSVLALTLALHRRGLYPAATFPEPFEVPEYLRVLPGMELLVPPADLPEAPRTVVTLDSASADRLGSLGPLLDAAEQILVVDHHASNTGYGTSSLVDPDAAATGMLVAELVDRLGVPLDTEIAACLYAAVASDTGSFRHVSTTPAVHELAARLLATGLRHDVVSRALFDTHPVGWLSMLGQVLTRVVVEPGELTGLGLCWSSVTVRDVAEHHLPFDAAESVIDVIRTVDAAEVAAVFKEQPTGEWLVSVRSKGRLDVGAACVAMGGGGHRFAAGYTAWGPLADVVGGLRAALRAAPRLAG